MPSPPDESESVPGEAGSGPVDVPMPAFAPARVRGVAPAALIALLVLASMYTLFLGRAFFMPIALAAVGALALRPLVRALERLRIPEALGAAIVVGALVAGTLASMGALADPARELVRTAPERLRRIESRLRAIRQPMEDVSRATEQVERIARGEIGPAPTPVVVESDSIGGAIAESWTSAAVEAVVAVFLLYFFLASGRKFMGKLSRIVRDREQASRMRALAHEIERDVSRYLFTVAVINTIEGVLIALAAWALGMPTPALWGLIAALVNFVPYLGPLVGCGIMTLTALAVLPVERALLVPLIYLAITGIEGYLVTPMIVGRSLLLDPVAVFISVVFWGWIWGIAGTLLAVPLLVAIKVTCHRFERFVPVAELLGSPRAPRPAPP